MTIQRQLQRPGRFLANWLYETDSCSVDLDVLRKIYETEDRHVILRIN